MALEVQHRVTARICVTWNTPSWRPQRFGPGPPDVDSPEVRVDGLGSLRFRRAGGGGTTGTAPPQDAGYVSAEEMRQGSGLDPESIHCASKFWV